MHYVCQEHNIAFPSYSRFTFHWLASHKEEEKPAKEDVGMEELPEGVMIKQGKGIPPQPAPLVDPTRSLEVEELPTDPPELFYTILRLKGVNDATAMRLKQEFKLSQWMWNDAQEIAGLLKGAKLNVSPEWIRSFLKQYGHTLAAGGGETEYTFLGGNRSAGRHEFAGDFGFGVQGGGGYVQENPIDRYIRYQIVKDEKQAAQATPNPVTAEVESRIRAVESAIEQALQLSNTVLEELKQQREKAEKDLLIAKIEGLERRISEGTSGKSDTEGAWFKAFLDERESRTSDMISNMTQRLADASKIVAETQAKAEQARAEALREDREARERAHEELERMGYHPRQKNTEERFMDVVENQALPAIVGEVKAGRALLEKVTGGVSLPATGGPVNAAEADRLAALMDLESELKS